MENTNKIACLIIHGFIGNIDDIKSLDDYLKEKGYYTSCPKLKGHTGNPKDMKTANYIDWIRSAEEDLIDLMKKTDRLVLVGFSMGGLIAMNLGRKYDLEAIVTINTPIYYWNFKMILSNIMRDIRKKEWLYLRRYIQAKKDAPIISLINFLRLLNNTKAKIRNIKCSFLIVQTKDDDTTRLKSADYIYNNISSKDKKIKYYDKGGHKVLASQYKEEVIMNIETFIKNL